MVGVVNHKSGTLRVSLCSLAISTERGHLEGTVPGGPDLIVFVVPSNIVFVVSSF